jgi:isopenicillin-N N-acyltransferase like protein
MKKLFLKILKWCFIIILIIILFIIGLVQYSKYKLYSTSPKIPIEYQKDNFLLISNDSSFTYGNNWAKRNQYGLWEVFLTGSAFERGVAYGSLIKEPIQYQEEVFVNSINKVVHSGFYQWFLKNLIYVFLSDINNYVSEELKNEILGVSLSFSDEYDYIGEKYMRILAYHAAHDLGHALNNYSLVGCTSFSAWGNNTKDGHIIHARNFDFYFGDDFAKEKVLLIIQPDSGYAFISYSWPGMMGVVSGMNEEGLAITINASMSSPPTSAKLPISLLVRETLQFSKNLEEAKNYINSKKIFVSESIMISSANDNKTIIIEKTPEKTDLFEDNELIICSNHFQSSFFLNDSINIKNIKNTDSQHRYTRVNELIKKNSILDIKTSIEILRDNKGLNNKEIGFGNSHAINQLLAHHGIVFEPNKKNVWISTPPYQLGYFICYNLDSIFSSNNSEITQIIKEDSFLRTKEYEDFEKHKTIRNKLNDYILFNAQEPHFDKNKFIRLNPNSYNTYFILGRFYYKREEYKKAKEMFEQALQKDLPSQSLNKEIENYLILCSEKNN